MLRTSIVAFFVSVSFGASGVKHEAPADAPFQVASFSGTRVRVDIGADRQPGDLSGSNPSKSHASGRQW